MSSVSVWLLGGLTCSLFTDGCCALSRDQRAGRPAAGGHNALSRRRCPRPRSRHVRREPHDGGLATPRGLGDAARAQPDHARCCCRPAGASSRHSGSSSAPAPPRHRRHARQRHLRRLHLRGTLPLGRRDPHARPSADFLAKPPRLSTCELERLHKDCVDQINKCRSGELKFSDGSDDDNVRAGLGPLVESTGGHQCSSHQAG